MEGMPPASSRRLDSWKAIAEYLGRDVRTAKRWEKTLGLPVRRVPGGRGYSVFAYASEIDAWLKTSRPVGRQGDMPAEAPADAPTDRSGATASRPLGRWWPAAAVLAAAAILTWRARTPGADDVALTIRVTPTAVTATGPDGIERWRHRFPADERATLPGPRDSWPVVLKGARPGVVAATGYRMR